MCPLLCRGAADTGGRGAWDADGGRCGQRSAECCRPAVSLLQVSILLELGVKLAQEVVQLGLIRVNSRRELADLLVHLPHLILCEWRLLVFRIRPRNVLDLPLARLVERGGRAGSGRLTI